MTVSDGAKLAQFIEANLPDMPTDFDEGLGIASERFAVNKMLLKFLDEHAQGARPSRVLEAPVDGLMGIPGMNSVVFARDVGANVVVASPSEALLDYSAAYWEQLGLRDRVEFCHLVDDRLPFEDHSFDWVWNYCTFEHFDDAPSLLNEMTRVSRRYVCVVTQNAFNYGFPIHLLYHRLRHQQWDHGSARWMRMSALEQLFEDSHLNVVQRGCVDVPPWLDTFDMHIRGKVKGVMSSDGAKAWFWSSLQAEDADRLAQDPIIRGLERFQSALFFPLNYVFAHHFYLIGEVESASNARLAGEERPQLYDFAEGFGSVYGRYVRNRLSQRLVRDYGIQSVLEAPCNAESYFASPGTQSVVFARAGCDVTVLHPDPEIVDKTRQFWQRLGLGDTLVLRSDVRTLPFEDNRFDLVWNFDSIPLFQDPAEVIREMIRVSRDLVMVIVPNRGNIGYPLHALENTLTGRESLWGKSTWMSLEPVERVLRDEGLDVIEHGFVDSPPWPGFDAMRIVGQLVRRSTVQKAHARQRTDTEIEQMLRRFTFVEDGPWPTPLKALFTHQLYVVARKRHA
jgi:ubiquinone/menaquinone biosynthesis C-methylase UbiE